MNRYDMLKKTTRILRGESSLKVGDTVIARWSYYPKCYYSNAVIKKINRKTFTVVLNGSVFFSSPHGRVRSGAYHPGDLLRIPKVNTEKWDVNNRIEIIINKNHIVSTLPKNLQLIPMTPRVRVCISNHRVTSSPQVDNKPKVKRGPKLNRPYILTFE